MMVIFLDGASLNLLGKLKCVEPFWKSNFIFSGLPGFLEQVNPFMLRRATQLFAQMETVTIPCFKDNYAYLLIDAKTRQGLI